MPRLQRHMRERAIGMLQAGMSTEVIAGKVGCSSRAIRYLRSRFHQTGCTDDRKRSGRPRVTTVRQDRYIINTHLRNRFQTATSTAASITGSHEKKICAQTVRSLLQKSRSMFTSSVQRRYSVKATSHEKTSVGRITFSVDVSTLE